MLEPVIEVCDRCGFELPAGADTCPACRRHDDPPSLVTRLIVGEALPTRSVHSLHSIAARRELPVVRTGPVEPARAAFGFATLLVLLALLGIAVSETARLERLVLDLPSHLRSNVDSLTVVATWASVIALGFGLVVLAARGLRRGAVAAERWWMEHNTFA